MIFGKSLKKVGAISLDPIISSFLYLELSLYLEQIFWTFEGSRWRDSTVILFHYIFIRFQGEDGANAEPDLMEIDLEELNNQQQITTKPNTLLDPPINGFTKDSPIIGRVQRVFLESVGSSEDSYVNSLRKKHSQDEACPTVKIW